MGTGGIFGYNVPNVPGPFEQMSLFWLYWVQSMFFLTCSHYRLGSIPGSLHIVWIQQKKYKIDVEM